MHTVAELMTRELITLNPEDDLALAETILALGGIRHLPVAEGRRLVGLLTHRDVLRACSNLPREDKRRILAHEVMKRDLVTVRPFTPLDVAFKLLLQHKIGCLPVVGEGDRIEGILTESDGIRFAIDRLSREQQLVAPFDEERPGLAVARAAVGS